MATGGGSKHKGGEMVRLEDLIGQLNSWLQKTTSQRKVLVRRKASNIMRGEERLMLQAARMLQDHGLISILTQHHKDIVTYVAERAA